MRHEHPVFFAAIVGGITGLSVAFVIAFIRPSSGMLVMVLWPSSAAGIAWTDPPGFNSTTFFMMAVMYGGNTIIYGIATSVGTGAVLGIRGLFGKKNRRPLSIKPD
jgi:hypothetical protein